MQIEALKQQFDRYNKLSTIQKVDTHIKIEQMNLTDLNPYEVGDQGHEKNKAQQKHETETATDEDLKGKSAEDQVKILRNNPKLLAKFIKEQEQKKIAEKKARIEKNYQYRLQRQKENSSLTGSLGRPIIRDFISYNAQRQGFEYQNPATRLVETKKRAAEQDFHAQLVLMKKK